MAIVTRKAIILVFLVGPLIATGYAIQVAWNRLVDWQDIAVLATMLTLAGLGVTIGYHRFLTHCSFKANRVVKFALVILGSLSYEGSPISWAANHRQHHAYSDQEGDLHSPQMNRGLFRGLFYAQVGWMIEGREADRQRWARDLLRDPDIVLLNRLTPLWFALALVIPFLIGGWSGLLWGGLVRIFLTHHVTWSVNSVCHVFGSRPFNTNDHSTNHWLVGLLGFGEGGHNTHHASPRSARHGLYWWHFDLSWVVIRVLSRLRLVYDVYTLDPEDLKRALPMRAAAVKATFWRGVRGARKAPPLKAGS